MKNNLYYLALPYQGTETEKLARAALALQVAAEFLRQGIYVFSPVTYSEPIAKAMNFSSLDARRDTLMPYLLEFLKMSRGLILLKMEGWERSQGIKQELLFCQKHDIPIYQLEPHEISGDLRAIFQKPFDSLEIQYLLKLVAV